MGKVLGWVGGIVTMLWGGLLVAYVVLKWDKIIDLEPNALGDLLGGSMGPLALIWLVLGYLQQGIELRQNGAALHLQAEELKHAVDQYKEMARVANEQLIHDKEAAMRAIKAESELQKRQKAAIQPNFIVSEVNGLHSTISKHNFTLTNAGGFANEVTLAFDDGTKLSLSRIAHWGRNQSYELIFETPLSKQIDAKELNISYFDADVEASSTAFVVNFSNQGNAFSMPVFLKKF